MAKRSCRRTVEENKIHEKAVKIRKMTDEQLVNYVEDRVAKAKSEGLNQGKSSGSEKSVSDFLTELSKTRGIGAATISKAKAFAIENGYMEETA